MLPKCGGMGYFMKFAIIGGDMRQAKLAELLAADGHEAVTFALEKIHPASGVTQAATPKKAAEGAACVILPLPLQQREGMLSAPLSSGIHTVREILSALSPEQKILLGRADAASREQLEAFGLKYIDYFEREELAVLNSVAAAEGAIGLIMQDTAITIWGAKILVIGYGRMGKTLARRLLALGADVTVSARTHADLAWISVDGMTPAPISKLDGTLCEYDVIVNAVPALMLDEKRLSELREDTLCLDLASKPGGVDFIAAAKLGVRAMWALSLPGEVAPVTSGAIIRDTIYNILQEETPSD